MELTTFDEVLEYVNEVLAMHGDVLLTKSTLISLYKLYLELKKLDKLGITTDNYPNKVQSYNNLKDKLIDTFGIDCLPSIPFRSPSQINDQAKLYMTNAGLNDVQIKNMFREIYDAKRAPNKKSLISSGLFDDAYVDFDQTELLKDFDPLVCISRSDIKSLL